jgi:hypothetical protein
VTAALYDKARESFLKGEFDLATDNVKVVLVDAGQYTVSLSADQFLSDIPAGARTATSPNLTTKTTTAGVFDADDVTFSAVSGVQSEALVIYQDTGTAGTSRLICYEDNATGLPVTPSGADITVRWSNGSDRIFKL